MIGISVLSFLQDFDTAG